MAKTLTNEQNLERRQAGIARELNWLHRTRLIEWGVALACLALGAIIFFAIRDVKLLVLGGILVFLALGHEVRRTESTRELAEMEEMRGAKENFARILDEKLANDHYILNDLHLKVEREKCWIDHVVVAPSGIFVIDTLNWSGRIIGDTARQSHTWKIRDPQGKTRPARNPLSRVLRERRILCNWLKGTNLIWERVFPLVVLANPDAEISVTNAERRVLTPDQAVQFINDFCFEKPILANHEVEKLANGLHQQTTA